MLSAMLSAMATTAVVTMISVSGFAADLMVTIHEVRSDRGVISVAVYDSEGAFLMDGAQIASANLTAMRGEAPVVFKGLPPGTYAVAAFHDENGSGKFDTNFLGIPVEGYGFSNHAMAFLGPPSFSDAAVSVENVVSTDLVLSY